MAHSLSIVFFFGLLVALGAILEFTLKSNWARIAAALRGDLTARPLAAKPALQRSVTVRWHAAA